MQRGDRPSQSASTGVGEVRQDTSAREPADVPLTDVVTSAESLRDGPSEIEAAVAAFGSEVSQPETPASDGLEDPLPQTPGKSLDELDPRNWTSKESGGSQGGKGGIAIDGADLVLREGDSFEVRAAQRLVIPAGVTELQIEYRASFDSAGNHLINDAFELALLDDAGSSLVPTIRFGRDSFVNLTEAQPAAELGLLTEHIVGTPSPDATAAGSIALDVTHLADGVTPRTLIARLVNNDGDTGSVVRILGISEPVEDPPEVNVPDLVGIEGQAVELVSTFRGLGSPIESIGIDWGDGSPLLSSHDPDAAISVEASAGTGTIRVSHTYADDRPDDYAVTVSVTWADGTTIGEGIARVANADPELSSIVSYQPMHLVPRTPRSRPSLWCPGSCPDMGVVFWGKFTDPGWDNPAAGAAETFTAIVDWGDGTQEIITPAQMTLVQEADRQGVKLTRGHYGAAHIYADDGVHTITTTVWDDDGGSDQTARTGDTVCTGWIETSSNFSQQGSIAEAASVAPAAAAELGPGNSIASAASADSVVADAGPLDESALGATALAAASVPNPFDAGTDVLISGQVPPQVALAGVSIDGVQVDAVDAANHFFQVVSAQPGRNTFEIVARALDGTEQLRDVVTFQAVDRDAAGVDFGLLVDASASVQGQYGITSFHEQSNVLYADVALRNEAGYTLQTPLLVGVANLSDPSTRVRQHDGVTPDGIPYYDFTDLLRAASPLGPGDSTGMGTLAFHNPDREPFTYELVVLGRPNKPPRFITAPVVQVAAREAASFEYRYESRAYDENSDAFVFELLAGPQGMVMDPASGLERTERDGH